jgi:hypothetical protein
MAVPEKLAEIGRHPEAMDPAKLEQLEASLGCLALVAGPTRDAELARRVGDDGEAEYREPYAAGFHAELPPEARWREDGWPSTCSGGASTGPGTDGRPLPQPPGAR